MKKLNAGLAESLLQCAKEAAKNAYAPHSKFPVGAALLAETGEVYLGANVENASLGLTICAERAAVAAAVTLGARKFTAIAIFSPKAKTPLYPCGACLQVLAEFAADLDIFTTSAEGKTLRATLKKLLPKAFGR